MFRKISENILSAVSPFSSALSTPAVESPPSESSTPDISSLSLTHPSSADPNTHQGRADAEKRLAEELERYGVPMSKEDCFGCDDHRDGCDDGSGVGDVTHVQYPRGFEVDWETDLLASSKPQPRQLVISTGKSDWPHDHTEDESTLSHHLNHALLVAAGITPSPPPKPDTKKDEKPAPPLPAPAPPVQDPSKKPGQVDVIVGKNGLPQGIYESPSTHVTHASPSESTTTVPQQPGTMLFSSSLVSQSHEGHRETVLVLPDWKVVLDVENSQAGAEGVLRDLVVRTEGEKEGRRTWTLPYRAVVLLCSHKRRDKRCHIAAPLLEKALIHSLEQHDVSIDLQGDSLSADHLEETYPPLDAVPVEDLDAEVENRLRSIDAVADESGNGQVGIFRISHLGGHRYAGVMIICFPSGATLYYGRVSPQEIPAVVKETILGGKILSGLLRSAGNAVRPELVQAEEGKDVKVVCQRKGKTLLSW